MASIDKFLLSLVKVLKDKGFVTLKELESALAYVKAGGDVFEKEKEAILWRGEKDRHTTLGRPYKGEGRRVQATIYADNKILEAVEKYARERKMAGERDYSRSEFYHEAAAAMLRVLGRLPEEETGGEDHAEGTS